MEFIKLKRKIAIVGGGPSALFMYKRLIESGFNHFEVEIFEKKNNLGSGMPYSPLGANNEHVTNVSDNEIPKIVTSISEWIHTAPKNLLEEFKICPDNFSEYKVLPRLFFGHYLTAQFELLQKSAVSKSIYTQVHYGTTVTDIDYDKTSKEIWIKTIDSVSQFDVVIICTGHNWPTRHEGKIKGYYDAPYPPSKLAKKFNHSVAIRGSSLTAIDAIRTVARSNGCFYKNDNDVLEFRSDEKSPEFKIIMHSRSGLLPAVRFHLEDSHLNSDSLLTEEEILLHRKKNDGFLSLDFLFQKNFKDAFIEKDYEFYKSIKDLSIEEFVDKMMDLRERIEPFLLLKAEYVQAEKSIKRHESIYWKEMLAVLSFAMNHPAKYLSAEDIQRLQKVLMPLISIVIAFVPQESCSELLALHQAGILQIVSVGEDSVVEPVSEGGIKYKLYGEDDKENIFYYETFIDCIGQPHLPYEDFPFKSMRDRKIISPATFRFKSTEIAKSALDCLVTEDSNHNYYLNASGIAINDNYQIIDQYGAYIKNVYIMAVPYISGFNPDYSGLDFCEAASLRIVQSIFGEV